MPSTTAVGAAVADGEAHARPADEVEPAAGRAVEDGVAGDRLAGGLGREVGLGDDRDAATGQALADVVVGLAGEGQLDAGPGERAERLARRAAQLEADRARAARRAPARRSGRPRTSGRPWSGAARMAVTGPWSRNAAATRASSGDAERMAERAGRQRRVRAAGRVGAPRRRADDGRQLLAGGTDRAQESAGSRR